MLLGEKAMANIDSMLKIRDITLPTKVHIIKTMAFPVVMYGCESWTIKKVESWRIDASVLWCWRKLESCLACKNIQPVNSKGNQSWIFTGRIDAEAEAPKEPDAGKNWTQVEKGMTEGEMFGCHHWLDMDMSLSKLWVLVMAREAWRAAVQGSQRVGHDWATELNWTLGSFQFSFFPWIHFPLPILRKLALIMFKYLLIYKISYI